MNETVIAAIRSAEPTNTPLGVTASEVRALQSLSEDGLDVSFLNGLEDVAAAENDEEAQKLLEDSFAKLKELEASQSNRASLALSSRERALGMHS